MNINVNDVFYHYNYYFLQIIEIKSKNRIIVKEINKKRVGKTDSGCHYILNPVINSFTDESLYVKDNKKGEETEIVFENNTAYILMPIYFENKKHENMKIRFKLWEKEEILENVEIENISIKQIQQSLEKNNNLFNITFRDKASLMIAKDNIYVLEWNPTCPKIKNLENWNVDYYDRYNECESVFFEIFKNEDLEKIFDEMFKECIYKIKE